ncbi:hypothetical protein K0M31_006771 [Melipona bicolor]|uniref:Uncharacterized protein n=1 Tax=Melipona bicolor TaxID=60889 RepID=A0AA40KLA8_9HYME|nr:hypothetical protein K0M31_006771 [Melipona bicolor]
MKRMPDKPDLARASRQAAVTLTVASGSQKTYAEIMSIARIKISEIGILEVCRLKKIFPETGEVKIARPIKKAYLRISGLENSITSTEVTLAMATAGACEVAECEVTSELGRYGDAHLWD